MLEINYVELYSPINYGTCTVNKEVFLVCPGIRYKVEFLYPEFIVVELMEEI